MPPHSSLSSLIDDNPRPVSRGLKIHPGFIGLDSLYLVIEYPHRDIYDFWSAGVENSHSPRLHNGVIYEDMVLRRGALGYKLSVWDGDARLFITDRVTDELKDQPHAGQGMGMMLQLGPKWLREYGDTYTTGGLFENVIAQLNIYTVKSPEKYPIRINRLDFTIDLLGVDVGTFNLDEWRQGWVGYATRKHFYDSSQPGRLEGLSIGSAQGSVQFRAYDKVAESIKTGDYDFWRSVWSYLRQSDDVSVARFEWTTKPYQARITGLRYLNDFTMEGFGGLANYLTDKWGRLCVPNPDDDNRSRWHLSPLWAEVRRIVSDWAVDDKAIAKREYHFNPDLNPHYLRSVTGWVGGVMARLGVQQNKQHPATVSDVLQMLDDEGLSLSEKAVDKHRLYARLRGGRRDA